VSRPASGCHAHGFAWAWVARKDTCPRKAVGMAPKRCSRGPGAGRMIVTIDGPAGAGKSSAARELARRLGFEFLDTGAMYRAVALAGLRGSWDFADDAAMAVLVEQTRIELPPGRVLLNGEDVTATIRTPEVTAATGLAADSPPVRRRLAQLQHQIAAGRNMICEGRDQGTVVF